MGGAATLGAAAAGLLFGLSLIVVIGPQNTFVLRQGIRNDHVAVVVGLSAIGDVVMIAVGVGGAGAVLARQSWLAPAAGAAGAAFLFGYAALAARRAVRAPDLAKQPSERVAGSLRAVVLACLAFTWLNPGVYIDTVVLVGPVSRSHGGQRWAFGVGAMAASVAWFAALGFGARLLAPLFARPAAWRVVDGAVAVVLAATAVRVVVAL